MKRRISAAIDLEMNYVWNDLKSLDFSRHTDTSVRNISSITSKD
jgi:hypothetical protein